MKVKNDYILIEYGGKQTKIHNTILNKYIETLINNQLTIDENERITFSLTYAYLKFDTPLVFNKTSILTEDDFDIRIINYQSNDDITPTQIVTNYYYKMDVSQNSAYDLNLDEYIKDLSSYLGRKITAIGFGDVYLNESRIYSCVDTTNYNMYVESVDETLLIARRDILSTDSFFYCPSNIVKGAIHLTDGQITGNYKLIGILKSVGLGVTSYAMGQEFNLTPYSTHVEIDTNIIEIKDEMTIEYKSEGLFPNSDLYPNNDLYPARIINEPLYPSEDLYPGIIYMPEIPYQYTLLKYEVYRQNTFDGTITDTGQYYLLSNLINGKQKIKMNIEYEGA